MCTPQIGILGCGGNLEQNDVQKGGQGLHYPGGTFRHYGLLPFVMETSHDKNKLWGSPGQFL